MLKDIDNPNMKFITKDINESKHSDCNKEIIERHYNTKLSLRKKKVTETLLSMKLNSQNYTIKTISDQLGSISGVPEEYVYSENELFKLFENLSIDMIFEKYLLNSIENIKLYGLTLIRQYILYIENKNSNIVVDKLLTSGKNIVEYSFTSLNSSIQKIRVSINLLKYYEYAYFTFL